jgi:hypothetical protein
MTASRGTQSDEDTPPILAWQWAILVKGNKERSHAGLSFGTGMAFAKAKTNTSLLRDGALVNIMVKIL